VKFLVLIISVLVKLFFIFIILVYLFLFILAFMFAERIIFQPQPSTYQDTIDIIKLTSEKDVLISAIHISNPNAEKTIIYSHGNAEDLGMILPILIEIRNNGFSVLAYDYRAYGTSEGIPSEKNSYQDITAAYKYLTDILKIPPKNIIALGRSLGGGVATELACKFPVGGLILESSFLSAYRVITKIPLFPFDIYSNYRKIKNINCPLLVIHGINDEVIPFWHGKTLFDMANHPKMFYAVENAGHNDLFLVAGKEYGHQLLKFSQNLME
jgi:abhydrolase domain-containing protein 17